MTREGKEYEAVLAVAAQYARGWLDAVGDRRVGPRVTDNELVATFGGSLPDHGTAPDEVLDLLGQNAEPGLMAIQSGRFCGWAALVEGLAQQASAIANGVKAVDRIEVLNDVVYTQVCDADVLRTIDAIRKVAAEVGA